jgi:2-haloacid dehalogenase
MPDRWATFDCYGTLIDWDGGIEATLRRLWPDQDTAALLERYHRVEPEVQRGRSLPYRRVMQESLRGVAEGAGLDLRPEDSGALGDALPTWPPFPDVPPALRELRRRGWGLALLSNTDPDLLEASAARLGVPIDLMVTVREAGSYKPAHGHWRRFFELTEPAGPAPGGQGRHMHVAASPFHDLAPAAELGLTAVWINRLGETSDLPRAAELPDLTGLPDVLDRLVPPATR